jgi:hypothetical protein
MPKNPKINEKRLGQFSTGNGAFPAQPFGGPPGASKPRPSVIKPALS